MQVVEKIEKTTNALDKWRHIFASEISDVDKIILEMTKSKASLIPQLVGHIISSGGKRIRPILTVLSAKMCRYEGRSHLDLAACIEFIHTATLLHDDVVDESKLRRGKDTANTVWGNQASVLVGDFLLSKSFQLMARVGSLRVYELLSNTSAIITEGEVKQLMSVSCIDTSEEDYIDIITSKTAQLFAAACQVGAMVADRPDKEEKALSDFGTNLGIVFQIVDDALDYSAKQEELGKTIGDDFREGKVTLPIILAYRNGSDEQRKFLEKVIEGRPEGR